MRWPPCTCKDLRTSASLDVVSLAFLVLVTVLQGASGRLGTCSGTAGEGGEDTEGIPVSQTSPLVLSLGCTLEAPGSFPKS